MSKIALTPNASGSGTFTIAAPNGDTDRTLTLPDSSATLATTNGITVAEQWVLTSSSSLSSATVVDITSNLSLYGRSGTGTINNGMSESSGIFTFPSTGIWLVKAHANFSKNGDSRATELIIQVSIDSGSSYGQAAKGMSHITRNNSNTTLSEANAEYLVDVTDTGTTKIKFSTDITHTGITLRGSSTTAETSFIFIRLGDT